MWPSYFPAQCPPSDARQEEVNVYRLVSECPPSAKDFQTTKEEFPHRSFKEEELCNACGVSVFKDIGDIVKKRAMYSNLKGKKVAFGTISPDDGFVKDTFQRSHMTWWLQTIEPQSKFSEVEGV